MKKIIGIIISLILFIISALFFSQNDSLIVINYFSGELTWQLNWIIILTLFIGFTLGIFSMLSSLLKTKFELRQTKIKLDKQSKEINNLRALPIKDQY